MAGKEPNDKDAIEELLALSYQVYPEPVDLFEDRLAELLGYRRHPSLAYEDWQRVRVALIGADPRADEMAERVEAEQG